MRALRRTVSWFANPNRCVTLVLVALLVFLAIAAPGLWGHGASATSVDAANQGPSWAHWMGTDQLGRDVLERTLVATRSSLVLAVLATAFGGVVGVALGLLSAVTGRVGRRLLGGLINVLLAFPALLLAIFFAVIFGIGSAGSVLAVGASFTPGFARLTQTLAASIADRDFIKAARALGKGPLQIVTRHILPNTAEPIIVYGTIHVGTAILTLAGLSFLGLGEQPPAYDWGQLLHVGLTSIYLTPTVALAPAIAIVVAGVACNLAGELLADVVGGRTRASQSKTARALLNRLAHERTTEAQRRRAADPRHDEEALLDVRGLEVRFPSPTGVTTPVRDVSFRLGQRERLGIVGESGSGKSLTAMAVARLLGEPARVTAQRLDFMGVSLLGRPGEHAALLGRRMALVFQNPGESLNPAVKIGTHLREPAQVHLGVPKKIAVVRALDALRAVAIPQPRRRYRQHRHELSGGMQQRVTVAIGLMGEPRVLIADEPTTALDVSVQRRILQLLLDVGDREQAGLILISHDIAVVAQVCDRVLVMYAGFVVEEASTETLIAAPAHPYTAVLLASTPTMEIDTDAPLPTIEGRVPAPDVSLPGCYFAPRCPRADGRCRSERPSLEMLRPGQQVACWHPVSPGDSMRPATARSPELSKGAG